MQTFKNMEMLYSLLIFLLIKESFEQVMNTEEEMLNTLFDLSHGYSSLRKISGQITHSVPNWYRYNYDDHSTTPTSIVDGGLDMYDTGNKITIKETGRTSSTINVVYNRTHSFANAIVASWQMYPFITLLRIDNNDGIPFTYTMRVEGRGAEGSIASTFSGNVSSEGFTAQYHVYQSTGSTNRPSICEVYFLMYSRQVWLSQLPVTFQASFGPDPYNLNNSVTIYGTPSRVVIGYTLLSRFPSLLVKRSHVDSVLKMIISALGNADNECIYMSHYCDDKATCKDTPGSFTCECNAGFEGNGFICRDINECVAATEKCAQNTECYNTIGGYSCMCKSGYSGDNILCEDIDECNLGYSNCHYNATCKNLPGSYQCICPANMKGDGVHCGEYHTECLPDSMTFTISSNYFSGRDVELEDFYLRDFECKGYLDPTSSNKWIFNVSTLSSCGTTLLENDTHLIYSNAMTNWVYTGSAQEILFSCAYKKELENLTILSSRYEVIKSIANISALSGTGEYQATLNRYTDDSYSEVDIRQEYKTSDILHIKAQLHTSDQYLNLVIDKCWVTPSISMDDSIKYTFIEAGCPIGRKLGHVKVTQSGKGNIAHFESQVFAFIKYHVTYLHCSLKICSSEDGKECVPFCLSRNKRSAFNFEHTSKARKSKEDKSGSGTVSLGPLTLEKEIASLQSNLVLPDSTLFVSVLLLLFLALTFTITTCCAVVGCWLFGKHRHYEKSVIDCNKEHH